MGNLSSIKFDLSQEQKLKLVLKEKGYSFKQADHALWRAQNGETTITLYKTGKLLIQGKDPCLFQEKIPADEKPRETTVSTNKYESWIGTDESGKGDYFGPLVIASVLADENSLKKLSTLGIQDSKKLSDNFINKIAPQIKEVSVFSVVTINPLKYNELYEKIGNLNSFLAWGHARAIENILDKKPCKNALSDKFGNESFIKNALLKKGREINLEQRVRAEEDIAVAAASILARDEFVRKINKMSEEYGIKLPKGASEEVIKQAKLFVSKYGNDKLKNIAKLHFKTTSKII